ncbi:MAG: FAD-binding oxidoreductase [Phycisphaerales bacterium]
MSSSAAAIETGLNGRVSSRRDLTDRYAIFGVRPASGRIAPFEPGQFLTVGVPARNGETIERPISIASSPANASEYELLMRRVVDGSFSRAAWALKPGDRVQLGGRPQGSFTLVETPHDRHLIMVASGAGLAPYMSMLRAYRGQQRWSRFILIHAVERTNELAYRKELETIAHDDETVDYLPLHGMNAEGSDWSEINEVLRALLDDAGDTDGRTLGSPLDPDRVVSFLCGSPDMIDAVRAGIADRLEIAGVQNPETRIHFERYW